MQNIFIDDGQGKKFAAVDERGDVLPYKNWDAVADEPLPLRVHTENSFQAKHFGEHDRILQKLWAAGHEVIVINPRITATKRSLWGLPKGTDVDDANVLRRIAMETNVHWSKARLRGLVPPTLQQKADELSLTKVLGSYKKMDGNYLVRGCLGSGAAWDKASALFVALALTSNTREEFLREMGMSGDGKPGLPRATFYRRVKTLVKRVAPKFEDAKPDPDSPDYVLYKSRRMNLQNALWNACQANLRKAILLMYHQVRADNEGSKDNGHSREKAGARTNETRKTRHTPAPATNFGGN